MNIVCVNWKLAGFQKVLLVSLIFDVGKHIRLVLPLNEKDVDKYFIVSERVVSTLKWPKAMWTLLLQCVLSEKAQKVCASILMEDSLDFEKVKATILRAYELVTEAYRQKFRKLRNQGH